MTRAESIRHIENLFPADSGFYETARIGSRLLSRAVDSFDWRDLPDEILAEYATLCIREDQSQ